jgi:tRNA (Thr-GGU) A37 N-methylase
LTLVKLLERRGNALLVEGLDAVDGSPVLDVKPFYPPYDEPRGPTLVPDYVAKLAY